MSENMFEGKISTRSISGVLLLDRKWYSIVDGSFKEVIKKKDTSFYCFVEYQGSNDNEAIMVPSQNIVALRYKCE